MRKLGILIVSLIAMAAGLAALAPAAGAAERCHDINATGTGTATSPTTTVARIEDGGLLQGTTEGNFTPTSATTFVGPVTFTTNKGTLTVTINGSFPTPTSFTGEGDVTSSSGKLAGAEGRLRFDGVITDASGAFTETVTGQICFDRAP